MVFVAFALIVDGVLGQLAEGAFLSHQPEHGCRIK